MDIALIVALVVAILVIVVLIPRQRGWRRRNLIPVSAYCTGDTEYVFAE